MAAGLGVAASFIALLAFGLLAGAPDTTIEDGIARGQPVDAPGFDLDVLETGQLPPGLDAPLSERLDDGRVDLDELRGTPIVLNIWASWCTPCRDEAPRLERAWRSSGPRGVLFLGLNMQDVTGDARKFVDEFGLTFPHVRDPGADTASRYGATGIPETYFISARGHAVARVRGEVDDSQLRRGIRAARSGKPFRADGGDRREVR